MRKLDRGIAARIFEELDEIAKLEDPRVRGKSLTGNLAGVWRYRVGDYRILCDIDDGRLVRKSRRVNGAMRDHGGGVVPRSGSTETSFTDCGIDAAVSRQDQT